MPEDTPLNDDGPAMLARLTPDEWAIECGAESCGTILADIAWIDINYNMATNVAESQGSAPELVDLPAPHLRRYRMGVMFPFDWTWSKESNTWQLEGTRPLDQRRPVPKSLRVVRGNWSTGELGQLGSPPCLVRCWECGTLQSAPPVRRKGTPPAGKVPCNEPGTQPPASSPVPERRPPVRPLSGTVVGQRHHRRYR